MPPGGGEMKVNKMEAESAVPELEPLKNPTDEEINQMLSLLGYDALDNSTPDNRHERRLEMSKEALYRRFHAAGKHGELFVLRGDGDRIIGLLGLRADTPNSTGYVTLLRTGTREKAQVSITEKLLKAAERYLRESPRSCTQAIIDAPNPSEHVRTAARLGPLAHFYTFAGKTEETERATDTPVPEKGH